MNATFTLEQQIDALRHLLGDHEHMTDFHEPSLLKEIPSITTYNTSAIMVGDENARLEGGPSGNK